MRILLQQISTARFLDPDGRWTREAERARDFDHYLDAIVFARDHLGTPVGVYCSFPDPSYNFSVVLRDSGMKHVARLAATIAGVQLSQQGNSESPVSFNGNSVRMGKMSSLCR